MTSSQLSVRHIALLGGLRLRPVPVPERLLHVAAVGGVNLDLTGGDPPPEVTVTKVALVGGARVRVQADSIVEVQGFHLSTLLGRRSRLPEPVPGSATTSRVVVKAYGVFGGVAIERE